MMMMIIIIIIIMIINHYRTERGLVMAALNFQSLSVRADKGVGGGGLKSFLFQETLENGKS